MRKVTCLPRACESELVTLTTVMAEEVGDTRYRKDQEQVGISDQLTRGCSLATQLAR